MKVEMIHIIEINNKFNKMKKKTERDIAQNAK
jgi:hypothetical protein